MNSILSHVLVGLGSFVVGIIAKTYNPFVKTEDTGTTKKAKAAGAAA
jgi:hypothetical protein